MAYVEVESLREHIIHTPSYICRQPDTTDDIRFGAKNRQREILDILAKEPTVDVRENVRGTWVHGRETAREVLGDNTVAIFYEDYSCSSCGFKIDGLLWNWDGSLVYKFCPNCGTSMWG